MVFPVQSYCQIATCGACGNKYRQAEDNWPIDKHHYRPIKTNRPAMKYFANDGKNFWIWDSNFQCNVGHWNKIENRIDQKPMVIGGTCTEPSVRLYPLTCFIYPFLHLSKGAVVSSLKITLKIVWKYGLWMMIRCMISLSHSFTSNYKILPQALRFIAMPWSLEGHPLPFFLSRRKGWQGVTGCNFAL